MVCWRWENRRPTETSRSCGRDSNGVCWAWLCFRSGFGHWGSRALVASTKTALIFVFLHVFTGGRRGLLDLLWAFLLARIRFCAFHLVPAFFGRYGGISL